MVERETIYVDMDGVLCDFVGAAIKALGSDLPPEDTDERKKAIDDCQAIPHFYLDLEPIPGALEGYKALDERYDVYILSAPSWDNPFSFSDKRIWVENHLGLIVYKKLILTHNKGHFKGRALIDDRIKYGVDKFDGEHIHFGTNRFPDWDSVIKYLL